MNSQLPLADRVAIVTGGGRGLGRARALGLAGAGANVIVTAARERAEIEHVAQEVGTDASIVPMLADVIREDDCQQVVASALDRFGPARHIGQQRRWRRRRNLLFLAEV